MTSERDPSCRAVHIAQALAQAHGGPDLGNKSDPLDELIYIALTRRTNQKNAQRAWHAVSAKYSPWDVLLRAPEADIASTIACGGLSLQKARWIKQALQHIKEVCGSLSLEFLRELGDAEAERYLCGLPGINTKSAKCILMYSLRRQVLPVDTHVRRVSERLGLLELGLSSRPMHQQPEAVVPPAWRHAYHVNIVVHGRQICTALKPKCGLCVVASLCKEHTGLPQPHGDVRD